MTLGQRAKLANVLNQFIHDEIADSTEYSDVYWPDGLDELLVQACSTVIDGVSVGFRKCLDEYRDVIFND